MHTRAFLILIAAGALSSACTRDDAEVAQSPDAAPSGATASSEAPTALSAEAWVDDVQLGAAPSDTASASTTPITQPMDDFAPGEPIRLSMSVDDAPQGTSVTTYWYGPENQALGYETKQIAADQQRLSFTQDNTLDWRHGQYRAEIWVGDEKVSDQTFEIVAG